MQRTSTKLLPSRPDPFARLRSEFETWRQSRKPGERIAEPLWKAAARLAEIHGLSPVCSALKLNYYDLQRRVGGTPRPRTLSAPAFVTLPPPVPTDPGTFELIHPNGSRLSLRLPNPKPRDLLPLVQAFLRS